MPQVDITNASSDTIDFLSLFKEVEDTILSVDSGAGLCKSRGYLTHCALPPHVFVGIGLLQKNHRDKVFMDLLTKKILDAVSKYVRCDRIIYVNLYFLSPSYGSCFGNGAQSF